MIGFKVGDLVYAREKTYRADSWEYFKEHCPTRKFKVDLIARGRIDAPQFGTRFMSFNPSDLIKVSCETCGNPKCDPLSCGRFNDFDLWQPKNQNIIPESEKRFCYFCKFEKLKGNQEPCKTCTKSNTYGEGWQPKEQEKNMAIDSNGNISPYVCGTASTEQPKEAPMKYELIKDIPIWEFMQKTYEDHRRINMEYFHADINHWFGCGAIIKEINDVIHDAVWSSYFIPKLIQYGYIKEVEEETYKVGDRFKNNDDDDIIRIVRMNVDKYCFIHEGNSSYYGYPAGRTSKTLEKKDLEELISLNLDKDFKKL